MWSGWQRSAIFSTQRMRCLLVVSGVATVAVFMRSPSTTAADNSVERQVWFLAGGKSIEGGRLANGVRLRYRLNRVVRDGGSGVSCCGEGNYGDWLDQSSGGGLSGEWGGSG